MKPSSSLVLLLMTLLQSQVVMVFAQAVKPVKHGQFPYLVLIKHDTSEGPKFYTGTLLSLGWVLTLSEEISNIKDEDISSLTVFAGFTKMADIGAAQRQPVNEFYKTVKENNENYPALLLFKLTEPFVGGPNVKPVQVNNGQIGDKCLVAGWGRLTSNDNSGPEFVQTSSNIYETTKCSEYYNLISFESQICSLQSFEYSFFPGSAMLCSDTLTAVKSVDTYMKPFSSAERIIVFIRAKPFTVWMRSHALDMQPMVYLKGSRSLTDNLLETWEGRGSKRSGGHHEGHATDNKNSGAGVMSHSTGFTVSCVVLIAAVYRSWAALLA